MKAARGRANYVSPATGTNRDTGPIQPSRFSAMMMSEDAKFALGY
jgi:hypothetical protein